ADLRSSTALLARLRRPYPTVQPPRRRAPAPPPTEAVMRNARLLPLALLLCLPLAAVAQEKPDLDKLLEKRVYKKDKASLPYRLLKPDGYKDDAQDSYPLVVFLHGGGERGDDNEKQLVHGVAEFAKDESR